MTQPESFPDIDIDSLGSADPSETDDVNDITAPKTDTYYGDEKVKLTNEQVAQIWRRIDAGRKVQDERLKPVVEEANSLWEGRHWPDSKFSNGLHGKLVINIIPNTIKSLVESVAYSNPDFNIIPRNAYGEQTQGVIKSALQYWWDQSNVSDHRKRAVWDSKLYGVGVVQVGWLYQTEDITLEDDRLETLPDGVTTDAAKEAESLGLLNPGEKAEDYTDRDPIEDRFLARRIHPMDFIVPLGATSMLDELAWCCKVTRIPLTELRKDRRFRSGRKNSKGTYSTDTVMSVKELRGTIKLTAPYSNYESYVTPARDQTKEGQEPPDVRYVELYEYYDRITRFHVILTTEDRTRYLFAEKWTWKTNRFPFRTIHNTCRPDDFYGVSVPCALWHLQFELNVSRSASLEHAQQFNRMYQCPEGALSDKAINELKGGEPGSVILTKEGFSNPIQKIDHLQLQPEMYTIYQQALQGFEQISGLSQYQMHAPPSKRMTNDESQAIQQAGGILFMADANAVLKLDKELAEDLLAYCEQFDTVIEDLPVNDGNDNNKTWRRFTGREIRGNYLVDIWPKSTQPPDAGAELQQNELATKVVLQATQIAQQSGGQLPRPIAIMFRENLRIIGIRNIDQLIPLPPEHPVQPQLPPGQGMPPGMPGNAPPQPQLPLAPALTPAPAGPPAGPPQQSDINPTQLQAILAMLQAKQ